MLINFLFEDDGYNDDDFHWSQKNISDNQRKIGFNYNDEIFYIKKSLIIQIYWEFFLISSKLSLTSFLKTFFILQNCFIQIFKSSTSQYERYKKLSFALKRFGVHGCGMGIHSDGWNSTLLKVLVAVFLLRRFRVMASLRERKYFTTTN